MKKKDIFITKSANQTRKLGEMLAKKLRGGKIICLVGELGSGKTTFAQGVLKGLGAKGPYTSPTFVILKRYKIKNQKSKVKNSSKNSKVKNIYHVDTYRIGPKDILDLGWREIISDKHNIIIVEWAEKIRRIIPKSAVWLKLEHKGKDEREITIK